MADDESDRIARRIGRAARRGEREGGASLASGGEGRDGLGGVGAVPIAGDRLTFPWAGQPEIGKSRATYRPSEARKEGGVRMKKGLTSAF